MPNKYQAIVSITTAVLLLAGWGCNQKNPTKDLSSANGDIAYSEQSTASLAVENQTLVESSVSIPKVTLGADGWIVVHADNGGVPGDIIGKTLLTAGVHSNIKIQVEEGKVTEIVHAMLHTDAGTKGTFEFPGADVPVTMNNVAVSGSFKVTKTTAAESEKNNDVTVKTDASANVKVEVTPKLPETKSPEATPSASVKSFTITAKNWEFSPSTITVKKGDTVRLAIKSVDVAHGFFLTAFNINKNLQPGQTTNVEFVADKTGSFSFKCNVLCGAGHGSMKGTLVVE